jgi:hypothetical protein
VLPEERPESGETRMRGLHAKQGKRKGVLSRNLLGFLA